MRGRAASERGDMLGAARAADAAVELSELMSAAGLSVELSQLATVRLVGALAHDGRRTSRARADALLAGVVARWAEMDVKALDALEAALSRTPEESSTAQSSKAVLSAPAPARPEDFQRRP